MSYRVPSRAALLAKAAERASANPMFMGSILRAERRGVFDVAEIATMFGADQASIASLALCRCPRRSAEHFARDVQSIAASSGISAESIAALVRCVDALAAIRDAGAAPLMAAAQDEIGPSQIPPTADP